MFGNAHYYLGKKIIKKWSRRLSKSQEVAFLSGEVLADVGRVYLDNLTETVTDSFEFVDSIKKVSQNDVEKYFALGMEAHVIQDGETNQVLNNVFGPGDWFTLGQSYSFE